MRFKTFQKSKQFEFLLALGFLGELSWHVIQGSERPWLIIINPGLIGQMECVMCMVCIIIMIINEIMLFNAYNDI